MIYLMSELGAVLLMGALFVCMIVIFFKKSNFMKKAVHMSITLILIIAIPIFGHSDLNKKYRLTLELNNLQHDYSKSYLETLAIDEIAQANHPLSIKIISSKRKPYDGANIYSDEVVKINGVKYKIKLACYLTPFTNTPFETWKIYSVLKLQ